MSEDNDSNRSGSAPVLEHNVVHSVVNLPTIPVMVLANGVP